MAEIKLLAVSALLWVSVFPLSLLIVSVPLSILFFYWLVVTQPLRRLLRPDLGPPLTGLDFGFSFDDFHGRPLGPLAVEMTVDGKLDANYVKRRLTAALNTSSIGYKRLTSIYPTFWLGYPFWAKSNRKFEVRNHMRVLRGNQPKVILKKWFNSPFATGQPLWDCLLIPGYQHDDGTTKSIFAIRIHHLIGDGVSLQNLVHKEIHDHMDIYTPQSCQLPFHYIILHNSKKLFWTPLILCREIYYSALTSDALSARNSLESAEFLETDISISLQDIKALRQRCSQELAISSVTLLNTVLLCLSGTLRRIYTKDVTTDPNKFKHINVSTATALPEIHPAIQKEYIGNHWGLCITKLQISENSPLKRLESLVDQEKWLKKSGAFETNLLLLKLNAILPRAMYSSLIQSLRGIRCGVTVVPPVAGKTVCGYTVSESQGMVGLQGKQTSMLFNVDSYNGMLNIATKIKASVLPARMTGEQIQGYFAAEVKHLLESKWQ